MLLDAIHVQPVPIHAQVALPPVTSHKAIGNGTIRVQKTQPDQGCQGQTHSGIQQTASSSIDASQAHQQFNKARCHTCHTCTTAAHCSAQPQLKGESQLQAPLPLRAQQSSGPPPQAEKVATSTTATTHKHAPRVRSAHSQLIYSEADVPTSPTYSKRRGCDLDGQDKQLQQAQKLETQPNNKMHLLPALTGCKHCLCMFITQGCHGCSSLLPSMKPTMALMSGK